tara:strand:+ start:92 stop:295 length:204 start_codon:yes stop_codon:yes gene_type:complete
MYSYRKDPLYPTADLTLNEIEISQNRAKKLRAHAFMSFINGLYKKKVGSDNQKAIQVQPKYANGVLK